jgi:glucokinase
MTPSIAQCAIGIDLGGTTINTAIVTKDGKLVTRSQTMTEAKKGVQAVIDNICNSIRNTCLQISSNPDELLAIGIGSPGPLNTQTGIVIDAPNLNGWVNVPLRDFVQQQFKPPVFLDNDANAAAFGEFWVGAGKGVRNLIVITLGTGVGGGLIIEGQLYRGPDDTSGEIGHTTVLIDGPICSCGNRGCLEALSSATALVNRALDTLRLGTKSGIILDLCENDLSKVTAKLIYEAAKKGDSLAIELFRETGFYLGIACANMVNVFNPEMIILFGGLINAGDLLFTPVREEIKKRAFPTPAARVKVVPAILGNDAGAIGAAGIALQELNKNL